MKITLKIDGVDKDFEQVVPVAESVVEAPVEVVPEAAVDAPVDETAAA